MVNRENKLKQNLNMPADRYVVKFIMAYVQKERERERERNRDKRGREMIKLSTGEII